MSRGKTYLENVYDHKFDIVKEYETDNGWCGLYRCNNPLFWVLVVRESSITEDTYTNNYHAVSGYVEWHGLQDLNIIAKFAGAKIIE